MTLLENAKLEELLLSVINFKTILGAPRILAANAKLQYLCTILSGESLRQFDTFCAQFGSTTMAYLNQAVLGLGMYFYL